MNEALYYLVVVHFNDVLDNDFQVWVLTGSRDIKSASPAGSSQPSAKAHLTNLSTL